MSRGWLTACSQMVDGAATRDKAGDVAIAGGPGFWSWVLVDEVWRPP